jgi:hypothetical protein
MIPAEAPRPFHRPGWVYEENIDDGYRMFPDGSRMRFLSPGIVAALAALPTGGRRPWLDAYPPKTRTGSGAPSLTE